MIYLSWSVPNSGITVKHGTRKEVPTGDTFLFSHIPLPHVALNVGVTYINIYIYICILHSIYFEQFQTETQLTMAKASNCVVNLEREMAGQNRMGKEPSRKSVNIRVQ